MKVQQLAIAFFNQNSPNSTSSSSISSSSSWPQAFKRLRPLAVEIPEASGIEPVASIDLKGFGSPKALHQTASLKSAGARWNPTPEQIRMLESLYKSGVRTPNAQQIERITSELVSHGRIEGKNVFYWFQNHKARERQKQKRNPAQPSHCRSILHGNSHLPTTNTSTKGDEEEEESIDDGMLKRSRTGSWGLELDADDAQTLELFPLQPESINGS